VKKYPDSCPQERIVEEITNQGDGSRMTVRKDIKALVELGVLYIHKEKQNSSVHNVRIKVESYNILKSVLDELAKIREAFLSLAIASKEVIDWYYDEIRRIYNSNGGKLSKENVYEIDSLIQTTFDARISLWDLFQHFIGIYLLHSILEWPRKIADIKALDRLNTVLFETIKEIHTKVSKCNDTPKDLPLTGSKTYITGKVIDRLFFLKHEELYKAIINFEFVGLDEYAENVIDPLWKSGLQYAADGLYAAYQYSEDYQLEIQGRIDKSRDWREEVNRYVKGLSADTKAWLRSNSDKDYLKNT
jgi:DNA-binding Lrp family transcriptional regulator